ncbi:MAG TPA: nitroreductase [Rhodobacteraceae bacterium]|jgi:nitroreductase|nr:nitroreductase [Paracoccaceae bacterium]HBV55341.1 nitroreductase [Paracoccaceae bacterium]
MTEDLTTLTAILHRRHSTRAFRPDPVPDAVITEITRTAARVPSWCNAQPWQVHVTRKAETDRFREKLYATALAESSKPDLDWPKQYTGAYLDRRRTCGFQLYDAVGIAKGDRAASGKQMMENYRLFGAPHVAIITSEADLGTYGIMDTGGFIALWTIAAEAAGVASVPQAAVAAFAPLLRAEFDIPEHRRILCAISFGYEDTDAPINAFRTERAEMSEVLLWAGKDH